MTLSAEIDRWKKGWRALRFYQKCVKGGQLCFDIGANHGSRSAIFTLLGARTVAVEPNSRLTGFLRRLPRVTVEHKAVSDRPGRRVFLQNDNDQISSLNPDWKAKWPEFGHWSEETVDCTTLDQLIDRYGLPSFCKIDVEGHEPDVLAGLSKKIPLLSFEAAPDFGENSQKCIAHLSKIGRYEYNFSVGDDFRWVSTDWVEEQKALQLIRNEAGDLYARLLR